MAHTLEAIGIRKTFGGLQALKGVDFRVSEGEVVALIGDNGAGKSTLVKVLSGALQPDGGHVFVDGQQVAFDSPAEAQAYGVATVYQDLALAPDLDAVQNLYLGHELRVRGLGRLLHMLDERAMRRRASAFLDELDIRVQNLQVPVHSMSGGQRQGIAVARAVMYASRVIVLDEPTAALGVEQTGKVLELVERVRDRGVGVVLISHRLDEVARVADRVTVLRLGEVAADLGKHEVTPNRMVAAITGAHR